MRVPSFSPATIEERKYSRSGESPVISYQTFLVIIEGIRKSAPKEKDGKNPKFSSFLEHHIDGKLLLLANCLTVWSHLLRTHALHGPFLGPQGRLPAEPPSDHGSLGSQPTCRINVRLLVLKQKWGGAFYAGLSSLSSVINLFFLELSYPPQNTQPGGN